MTAILPGWLSMDTAPTDGTPVVGLVEGESVEVRWAEEPRCMLAVFSGGVGAFPPGWEDTFNGLASPEPTAWKPIEPRCPHGNLLDDDTPCDKCVDGYQGIDEAEEESR